MFSYCRCPYYPSKWMVRQAKILIYHWTAGRGHLLWTCAQHAMHKLWMWISSHGFQHIQAFQVPNSLPQCLFWMRATSLQPRCRNCTCREHLFLAIAIRGQFFIAQHLTTWWSLWSWYKIAEERSSESRNSQLEVWQPPVRWQINIDDLDDT